MYDEEFVGQKVLVTGASRGIGRSITVKLTTLGAKVTALGKCAEHLAKLKEEIPEIEEIICTDLENWEQTRQALTGKSFRFLVNNAGVFGADHFMDISSESFDKTIGINLKAVINVSQMVAKEMLKNEGEQSAILNISSLASKTIWPGTCVYSLSKGGLDILTKYMAVELGKLSEGKIRVNSINPAAVMTEMLENSMVEFNAKGFPPVNIEALMDRIPLGNALIENEQVVNAALFLLSNKQSGSITGQNLFIDAGYTVA